MRRLLSRRAAEISAGRLREAAKAARRMLQAGDLEALHDFRTSLRRLRVTLSFYRSSLGKAASKSMLSKLKALARSTNPGRDAEVWARWLRRAKAPDPRVKAALESLAARFERERDRAYKDFRARSLRAFKEIEGELHHRLSRAMAAESKDSFILAAASAIQAAAKELSRRLGRLKEGADERDFHVARIRVKRLRYLLEPFSAKSLIAELKRLQTLLGELHDMDGLAKAGGPQAGPLARRRARRLEAAVRRDWLSSRGQKLIQEAVSFSRTLSR
ncbi:MAG: CHAD domain-containing protein [Elusimicrobia bacterium]|nr:CHAD domain-containing protein [Elusimicrobiota bacterium]